MGPVAVSQDTIAALVDLGAFHLRLAATGRPARLWQAATIPDCCELVVAGVAGNEKAFGLAYKPRARQFMVYSKEGADEKDQAAD